ncbi:MAG TPA: hypothetical protein VGE39_00485 [Prosthecobacter sp.]
MKIAKETWGPYFREDANEPDHQLGWLSLRTSAKELGVSLKGHVWNSRASKQKLARKLLAAKLHATRSEWSLKISTGLYQVLS